MGLDQGDEVGVEEERLVAVTESMESDHEGGLRGRAQTRTGRRRRRRPGSRQAFSRLRVTRSCSIWSAVEITRELAWKPRCALIMFVNSWARSTFDISTAPEVTSEKLPPGVPTFSGPELFDADQRLLETRWRPASFAKVASER